MNADEFAVELSRCSPNVEDIVGRGLPVVYARSVVMSYRCADRGYRKIYDNPVVDLVHRYDLSTVEIGTITFSPLPVEADKYWLVGHEESEALLIDRESGEVLIVEYGTNGYVLYHCAASGEQFLDAIILLACFPFIDEETTLEAKSRQAAICAAKAGGDRYRSFYDYMFGCEITDE